jgi:hypothetical protein
MHMRRPQLIAMSPVSGRCRPKAAGNDREPRTSISWFSVRSRYEVAVRGTLRRNYAAPIR